MIYIVHEILFYGGFLSEAALLIVSVIYCNKGFNPKYLNSFPIFCLAELCADAIISLSNFSKVIKSSAYNILTLVELTYITYFLCLLIRSSFVKKIMVFLIILFYVEFSNILINYGLGFYFTREVFCESVIIIIPCLVFYIELFRSKTKIDLPRYPAYWIVTGILFYFTITIPVILSEHFFNSIGEPQIGSDLKIINSFSIIVSNVLYIKGCICRIKI